MKASLFHIPNNLNVDLCTGHAAGHIEVTYVNLIVTYNKIPPTKRQISTSTLPSIKPALIAKQDLIEASKDEAHLVQRGTC